MSISLYWPILLLGISLSVLSWFVMQALIHAFKKYQKNFETDSTVQLRDLFLFVDSFHLFLINLTLLILLSLITWILSGQVLLVLLSNLVFIAVPGFLWRFFKKRRYQLFEKQLPDALLVLAGGLKAGASLSTALQQLASQTRAPLSQELALVLREQRLGLSMEQSFLSLNQRIPTESTVLIVAAMRISSVTGGGLAETMERLSNTVRSRLQVQAKIKSLTAQGRLQAIVMCCLPFFLMFVLYQFEPQAVSMFWQSRSGWILLALITGLELLGIYMVRRIISIKI